MEYSLLQKVLKTTVRGMAELLWLVCPEKMIGVMAEVLFRSAGLCFAAAFIPRKTALTSRRKPKRHGIYAVLTSCPKHATS